MNVDDLARLMGMREAAASVALDGETMHVAAPDGSCCLDHARERIAALEAEPRWIHVGERVPESGVEILVLGEYWPVGFTPGVHLADYLAERAVSPWLSRCGERLFSVTHWRALPSLPEAEEATNDDATE